LFSISILYQEIIILKFNDCGNPVNCFKVFCVFVGKLIPLSTTIQKFGVGKISLKFSVWMMHPDFQYFLFVFYQITPVVFPS